MKPNYMWGAKVKIRGFRSNLYEIGAKDAKE